MCIRDSDYSIKKISKTDSTHKPIKAEFKIYFVSLDENKSLLVNDEALKDITINLTKVKGQGWVIDDMDNILSELMNK